MIIVPLELQEFQSEISELYLLEADKYAKGEDVSDLARALELVENMLSEIMEILDDLDCEELREF